MGDVSVVSLGEKAVTLDSARRTGTVGPPGPESPGKARPAITAGCRNAYQTYIADKSPQLLWHLDSLSHVALIGGGHPHQPSCDLLPGKHKQEASRTEPKSLRPLQAEKESVPFSGHPYCRFININLSLSFGVRRRSPLSVCFFCRLTIGRSRGHFAGDGTPSRAKCTHCTSSNAVCIFTEPTKVCSFPPSRSVIRLNTMCRRPEVLQNGILSWLILFRIRINSIYLRSYVDSLETRLEKMEGMLSRVCRCHL